MGVNAIAQIKTVEVDGPDGPAVAMMIAVNIGDAAAAVDFVAEVAEQFKLHRMLAPPQTSLLLVTVIGGLTAPAFAKRWSEIEAADPILRAFMARMDIADVVQGTAAGQQLSSASLLGPETTVPDAGESGD